MADLVRLVAAVLGQGKDGTSTPQSESLLIAAAQIGGMDMAYLASSGPEARKSFPWDDQFPRGGQGEAVERRAQFTPRGATSKELK